MNAEEMELARRFVACKGWVWLPGILVIDPADCCGWMGRVVAGGWWACAGGPDFSAPQFVGTMLEIKHPRPKFSLGTFASLDGFAPDLSDPLTRAGLLEVVRRAWGDETACVRFVYRYPMPSLWVWEAGVTGERQTGYDVSELAALLAALEAAPGV